MCRKFFKSLRVVSIPSLKTPMDPNHVLKHSSTSFQCLWRFVVVELKSREEYLQYHPKQIRQSANLDTKTFHIAEDFKIRKNCTFFKKLSTLRYINKNPNVDDESTDRECIKSVIEDLVEFVVVVK